MLLRTVVILCFVWGSACFADSWSGELNVHPLNLENGHGGDLATSTLRDNDGFLWIGTDNGLKRYDGYQIQSFTFDPNDPSSIGSDIITTIKILSSGKLWAAGKTLSEYHPETESFTNYKISDNGTIRALYEDSQGILWFAGEGFGLRGFDLKTKKVVHQFFNHEINAHIRSIVPHREPSSIMGQTPAHSSAPAMLIWVLIEAKLVLFNTQTHTFQEYAIPEEVGLNSDSAAGMIEDRHGKVWIATQKGLLVFNPKTTKFKRYPADPSKKGELSTDTLWGILEDSRGRIWIGTDKQGVHIYQPESDNFLHYSSSSTDSTAFPKGGIGHIFEDTEGTLWFSVSSFGVYQVNTHLEKFKVIKRRNEAGVTIKYDSISDLMEDKEGNLWIAVDGDGLDRYDPKTKTFTHYRNDPKNPRTISSNSVLSLAEDDQGYIWVGTWAGGLNRLNPITGEFDRIQRDLNSQDGNTLGGDNIFRIEIAPNGLLLLSVWQNGLQTYNPKTLQFKSYFGTVTGADNDGAMNISIYDILLSSDGKYWIGGYRGLELFDPINETFTPANIQNLGAVFDIHEDTNKILWIASSTHFIRYNPKTQKTKYFDVKDGLSNNFVISIEEDDQEHLWLGTRNGLNRFTPKTEVFETYGVLDGLAGPKFNRFSHLQTKNQKMYFGGKDGLNFFDPTHLPKNQYPPKVHLTNFEIFQIPIIPGEHRWLDKNINLMDSIVLPSTHNDVTFEFTALNLITPTKNKYKYKMEGINENWVTVDSNRRRAHYSNLDPGHYKFMVHGSNNDGVWSSKAKEIELTILPAWWQTWWARLGYLIILFYIMYGFSHWRLRLNRKRQQGLEFKVLHDPLTNLPNRIWLIQHLENLIIPPNALFNHYAVLFLDGDHFKQVNDKYGHIFGDTLIKSAAKRIISLLPRESHLVRLEGDQFIVIINKVESTKQAEELAKRITTLFEKPFSIDNLTIKFGFSIGILLCDSSYTEPNDIFRHADIAMNAAKKIGGRGKKVFDTTMLKNTEEISAMEEDLRTALELNQFSVVYQPIIILETGDLTGFEILLRWSHPEKGMIPPDKFIPIAENAGLIYDIGLWVFKQACLQQQKWQRDLQLNNYPVVSINLSPLQLLHSNLTDEIDEILLSTRLDSRQLKLEITETALMENIETAGLILEDLRKRGIEFSIDDFGTGYSSLSYLSKLPAQTLKIDRSFVNALTEENSKKESKEIVKAMTSLAHNLNMNVVAEGIETQEQMDELTSYGCDYGQGYFIARPLSPENATSLLKRSTIGK